MEQQKYFFASGTEQRGPFTLAEFLSLGLRPDTLVWREGMSQWQRLDSVPELMTPQAPAPTPQPSASPASASRLMPLMREQPLSYLTPGTGQLPASGLAIASMVLGIIAIVSLCTGHFSFIALPCSILAVTFGFIAKGKANRNEAGGRGMAIAGIVCGCIHLGLVVLILLSVLGICVAVGLHMPRH